jgi:rhodanese-related sulfurtransferase
MKYFFILMALAASVSCQSNNSKTAPDPAPDTIRVNKNMAATTAGLMVVNMDANEFKTTYEKVKNAILLDVRTNGEYADGHLVNSKNIDVDNDSWDKNIATLEKSQIYFVYCQGGSRSRVACKRLKELGFTNLYNLSNGIESWKDAGFDVVK